MSKSSKKNKLGLIAGLPILFFALSIIILNNNSNQTILSNKFYDSKSARQAEFTINKTSVMPETIQAEKDSTVVWKNVSGQTITLNFDNPLMSSVKISPGKSHRISIVEGMQTNFSVTPLGIGGVIIPE